MKNVNFFPEWRSEDYYFFADDLRKYPDAWLYVVWSRRGPGKTYSALRFFYENNVPIVYSKRTIDDVKIICANDKGIDLSPYVPINRDSGSTIKPHLIQKGLGGFYDRQDEDGNVIGAPFSYIAALNAMKTIKGMDLSVCDVLLLDEFIPQAGEIVKYKEGEMLLDLYMTIARDRLKRGRDQLKLVLFANAENISTPITNTLEIIDNMADLQASGRTHLYIEDRSILLHHITTEEIPITGAEQGGIFTGMQGTDWFNKAFGGEFSNNDFTLIGKKNVKNYQPLAAFIYQRRTYYIWRNEWSVYISGTRGNVQQVYDLSRDAEKMQFYIDWVMPLRDDLISGYITFSQYSLYDLFINYRKILNVQF